MTFNNSIQWLGHSPGLKLPNGNQMEDQPPQKQTGTEDTFN